MTYSTQKLLSGEHGNALQSLTLSALNWEIGRQLAAHPSLKMPTVRPTTPDEFRDEIVNLDTETNDTRGNARKLTLDELSKGLVATLGLIKDLGEVSDFNNNGQIVKPYAWLADRAVTPVSAILGNYSWRSDQAAKVASEQAKLLGLDADDIASKAKAKADALNAEKIAYAVAEVNSVTSPALMKEESSKLVEILVDLDGVDFNIFKLAKASAQNSLERTKQRVQAGLYATIDEEVILFANAA